MLARLLFCLYLASNSIGALACDDPTTPPPPPPPTTSCRDLPGSTTCTDWVNVGQTCLPNTATLPGPNQLGILYVDQTRTCTSVNGCGIVVNRFQDSNQVNTGNGCRFQ